MSAHPIELFTARSRAYVKFVRFVRYPVAIRSFLLESPLLRSALRVLDAGCGTGIVSLALREALVRRGLAPGPMHAFDLTPAMLELFRGTLRKRGIEGIELAQADVLRLDALPGSWSDYDLIVTASMLEYLPRERLGEALGELRSRLAKDGRLLLFITRSNWLTKPLIGRWWQSNLYEAGDLEQAFHQAGFRAIRFHRFPARFQHFGLWGHIVEASG